MNDMRVIIAAVLLSTIALSAIAEDMPPKIGAVFPEVILKESKFARTESRRITEEFTARRTAIDSDVEALKAKVSSLDRDAPTLNEQQKAERRKEVVDMDHAVKRKQHDFQADLESRKRSGIQKVIDRINTVVMRIAKDQKYDFIVQNAVYSSQTADLTKLVITEMDKESSN